MFQNVIFDSLEFFELFELEMCLSQFTLLEDEVVNFVFSNCRMLEKRSLSYVDGPIPVPLDDAFLADNVQGIRICDSGILFFNLYAPLFRHRGSGGMECIKELVT